VTALENLRLDLLRLHAGAGNAEGITRDIIAATALGEEAVRLLAGVRERGDSESTVSSNGAISASHIDRSSHLSTAMAIAAHSVARWIRLISLAENSGARTGVRIA
jgi:hypothetical protein